jgi:hypothetical protein
VLYQSSNWRKLGVDEASHMTQFIVDYLTTRVRGDATQVQVLLGSNPGGPGHGWLKRRFVRPAGQEVGPRPSPRPIEVWRPYPPKDDPTRYMATRVFIPAFYSDNLEMLAVDPHYVERVDPAARRREGAAARVWRLGIERRHDVRARLGSRAHRQASDTRAPQSLGFTPQQILPWHVIPNARWRPPQSATIYGSIDYGYGAPWSFHLHAILPGGHIRTFFEFYKAGVRDSEQARMIRIAIERLMAPAATAAAHAACRSGSSTTRRWTTTAARSG